MAAPVVPPAYEAEHTRILKSAFFMSRNAAQLAESLSKDTVRVGDDEDGGADDGPAKKKAKSSSKPGGASSSLPAAAAVDEEALAKVAKARSALVAQLRALPETVTGMFLERERYAVTAEVQGKLAAADDLPDGADVAALVAERLAADPRMKEAALLARVKGDPDYRKIQKDVANSLAVAAAAVGEADAEGDAGAGGEDEDDVVVQAARGDADLAGRVKCPITKRLMTDPVHGDKCTHVFSRQGFESMLMQAAKATSLKHLEAIVATTPQLGVRKCPIAGCAQTITWKALVADVETAVAVEEWQRKHGAKAKSGAGAGAGRGDDDDVDDDE